MSRRLSAAFSIVMFAVVGTAVFLLAMPVASWAGGSEDGWPKTFSCTFSQGTSWSFEDGEFKSEPVKALVFDISGINLDKQSAALSMDGKPRGELKIVRALNANSFIEVAGEGFLNLTTIYDRDSASGMYPAVHSRHFGVLGQPVFAQYAGTCSGK